MAEERFDPFALLGVARDAQPRAVKEAYFRKVREFPPETHPDQFAQVRKAYEVLSDPEARRRFAEADPAVDPAVAERLRLARERLDAGEHLEAQALLEAVLVEQPGLSLARDLLAQALVARDKPEEALVQLQRLADEDPTAPHFLQLAFLHHHLKHEPEAERALRRAKELDPKDLQVRSALVDKLADEDRLDEALAEADEGIAALAAARLEDLELRARKVGVLLRREGWAPVQRELDAVRALVDRAGDDELRRYTASRLGSLAARLFAEQRAEDSNRLLGFCRSLNGESAVEVPYPTRARMRLDELPPASQEQLLERGRAESGSRTSRLVWAVGFQLAALIGLGLLLRPTFFSPSARDGSDTWGLGFFLILVFGAVAFASLNLYRALVAPLGRFSVIHALHLVQVEGEHVVVWPLVNLFSIQLTHHLQNNVYSHSVARLVFNQSVLDVTLRGQEVAEQWASDLDGQRRRVLELLNRGLLEAEAGVDFVPAALLARRAAGPTWTSKLYVGLGAVGAALLTLLVAGQVQPGRVDDAAFGEAVRQADLPGLARYLGSHPQGRHAAQARELRAAIYARAQAEVARRTLPGTPAATLMPAVVAALQAADADQVRLVIEEAAGAGVPAIGAGAERQGALRSALAEALARVAPGVIRVDPAAGPVSITVRRRATVAGQLVPLPDADLVPALAFEWAVGVRLPGDAVERHAFSLRTDPPAVLRLNRGKQLVAAAVQQQVDLATEQFFRAWMAEWGLPLDASHGRFRTQHVRVQPYLGGGR